ncbi:glycine--tRNA ligase [bacterium]|nr:glycine--tRNA ligase [bacterium]
MDKIVSLCKRRGYIFQSSEIYGGLGSTWDYGPLGVELKRNLKAWWWRNMVYERGDMEGLDAAILMHPKAWEASGHTKSFADLLVECKSCNGRFRQDLLKGESCPECGGELSSPRRFNLMFKTFLGSVEEEASTVYLRPETAQGIFVNFVNVQGAMRRRLPFGIAQIGKAFRNEITTGGFTFRSREFEQMEIEFFVEPESAKRWFDYWTEERLNWYVDLGIRRDNIRLREHTQDELAHYARHCFDIEYKFPSGWAELEGIANRTDFDLKKHSEFSGKQLSYHDEEKKEWIVPYIIEPSGGVDRAALAFLVDAYREEKVRGEKRVVLGLDRRLAPIKAAVLPLLRNRPEVVSMAKKIWENMRGPFRVTYDDTASIGRLYRRQDEVGTLLCITVDVQSLDDKKVTVRDRDTMEQDRVPIENLKPYLAEKMEVK